MMRALGRGSLALLLGWTASQARAANINNVLVEARALQQGNLLLERAENTTIAAPIVAGVSQFWDGNDGAWSSFAIQVGQKPQEVRVLPSTGATSTWVVYAEGCPSDAPTDCGESRGKFFNMNNSLTWVPNSIFELGIEANLDYSVFGDFGFDTVTLGFGGSGGPSVEHAIVAGIADTSFSWLGVLGLNPRPTNFSTFPNNPQVSFVQALKNQKSIPSVSWSYTAGAQYRLNKVFGSLIFGGYDTSRFLIPKSTSPNLTFPFYTDISRDLLVGVSSITTSNTTSSSSETKLLENGIFALIDSTVPHLWLPEQVCEKFESAFGLTWNETTELYVLNKTQHDRLVKLNPSVTINLSPVLPPASNDQAVAITLPYSAFNLNISWPHVETSSYYFPLKRAANDTQYTLGRTFLQEAYLTADYERSNFSVWPCNWDSSVDTPHVVAIHSVNETNSNPNNTPSGNGDDGGDAGKSEKKGLGSGAIAGIAVGVAALVIAVVAAAFFYIRHRRRKEAGKSMELDATSTSLDPVTRATAASYYPHKTSEENAELDSGARHELPGHQNFGMLEAPEGTQKFEMEGSDTVYEAGGKEKQAHNPNQVFEMDAGEHAGQVSPQIVIEPPTAISPHPGGVLPSPLPTPSQVEPIEDEKRLGYGPEGDEIRRN
ncbi:acid protease [Amniculicola lignicola CBS 123094]|uniref:Acid protease n=1 Tax=Amniculicola lignicola CBS 123094 TaxID=1392246 RepID=A0A6A5WU08_9PLEO|nr:acid protease [Amniculicola lignicola CBS 123094]